MYKIGEVSFLFNDRCFIDTIDTAVLVDIDCISWFHVYIVSLYFYSELTLCLFSVPLLLFAKSKRNITMLNDIKSPSCISYSALLNCSYRRHGSIRRYSVFVVYIAYFESWNKEIKTIKMTKIRFGFTFVDKAMSSMSDSNETK